jgi:lipopolysaccharide transport system ATP-binding protein
MSDIVIKAEGIGKKYTISHQTKERYATFRESLIRSAKGMVNWKKNNSSSTEDFWALSDLSFEIKRGEAVGVIGRNGAGKSTLLKVISRITEPTKGRLELEGRVASLLEVGTGFHPELTGRENIFLNGAILGMSQWEIKKNFDEIVEFSGVSRFLDTPVKRYSSGMYMRLAFSVAAHLESEILIIDEVLAVGDADFQKKCLAKMEDVSRGEGRTVLFVSHNMSAIQGLCQSCIWLDSGRIHQMGNTHDVIQDYQNIGTRALHTKEWQLDRAPGSNVVRLLKIAIIDQNLNAKYTFEPVEKIGILFEYLVLENGHTIWSGFNLYDAEGRNVFDSHSVTLEYYKKPHMTGMYQVVAWIPAHLLNEGFYSLNVGLFNLLKGEIHCLLKNEIAFSVADNLSYEGVTARGDLVNNSGIVRPLLQWEVLSVNNKVVLLNK